MPSRRRPRDRVAGGALVSGGALVVGAAILLSPSPTPPAADRLLAAMVAAERSTWSVTFDVTREVAPVQGDDVAGGAIEVVEVNRPPVRVRASGATLEVRADEVSVVCSIEVETTTCRSRRGATVPWTPVESVAAALAAGAYEAGAVADRRVAGHAATCFAVELASGPPLPAFGTASEHCFAADGVPLWTEVVRSGATDRRVARRVELDVDAGALDTLLARFEAAGAAAASAGPGWAGDPASRSSATG